MYWVKAKAPTVSFQVAKGDRGRVSVDDVQEEVSRVVMSLTVISWKTKTQTELKTSLLNLNKLNI